MPWPKGKPRSAETKTKLSEVSKGKRTGSDNSNWKGGVIEAGGRKFIKKPSHPNAMKSGYIGEHRLIKSEELGRPLTREEHVHHRDEIKSNNVSNNLQVVSSSEHTIIHNTGRKWSPEVKKKLSEAAVRRFDREGRETKICPNCQKEFFPRRTRTGKYCSAICYEPHRRGWNHSEEAKEKVRLARKGVKLTEEHRLKISLGLKRRHEIT